MNFLENKILYEKILLCVFNLFFHVKSLSVESVRTDFDKCLLQIFISKKTMNLIESVNFDYVDTL